MKKISLRQFEDTASKNEYEVFSPEELANKVKTTLLKSKSGEIPNEEVEDFKAIIKGMGKIKVFDEESQTEVIRYYTKVSDDILKSRSGRYADTSENRRLKRVGQEYGASKEGEQGSKEGDKKTGGSAKLAKYSDDKLNSAKSRYEKQLADAKKEGNSELEKKLNRRISRIEKEVKARGGKQENKTETPKSDKPVQKDSEKKSSEENEKQSSESLTLKQISKTEEHIEALKNKRSNLTPSVGKEVRNEIRNEIIEEEKYLKELKERLKESNKSEKDKKVSVTEEKNKESDKSKTKEEKKSKEKPLDLKSHLKDQLDRFDDLRKYRGGYKWRIGKGTVFIMPTKEENEFDIQIQTSRRGAMLGSYGIKSITREFLLHRINSLISR